MQKSLEFLKKVIPVKRTSSNLEDNPNSELEDADPSQAGDDYTTPLSARMPKKRRVVMDPLEELILKGVQERKDTEADEDRLWALSLVPSVKALNPFAKETLKIEIQQLILRKRFPQPQPFAPSPFETFNYPH